MTQLRSFGQVAAITILAALALACQAPPPPEPLVVPAVPAPTPSTPAPADPAASAAAPMTEFPTLVVTTLDGKTYDLAARRGTWVVVNFWATWCGPCLKEIPDLSAFDSARDDVEVIGLAYEEITPADLTAFLKKHPASYAIAILDVYNPPADFDTPRGLPMTYLIAPDGRVAKKFLGPVTSQDLAQAITEYPAAAG